MNIFEMMRQGELHPMWFGFVVQSIALAIMCVLLAKNKNRGQFTAALLGLVPFINYLALLYYVAVPRLSLKGS